MPSPVRLAAAAGALVAGAAVALLAARGAPIAWVLVAALACSWLGAVAIVLALAVTVAPGELVVLVGGRHRGRDRRWRGWRIVEGGRTLRLPGELVVRVPVEPERRQEVATAIDAALFARGSRGDVARTIGAAAAK